jgi:hypothetical protein
VSHNGESPALSKKAFHAMWIHGSPHRIEVGAWLKPRSESGMPPNVDDEDARDWVYIMWGTSLANVDNSAHTGDNRYCYEVVPDGKPLLDPPRPGVLGSWYRCKRARVVSVLREPAT